MAAGNATSVGEEKWFPWDPASEGAERATYNSQNGAVEWNLGEKFFLEEGVRYRCSFKVWPSQEAYDLIAKLNNGTLNYSDLTSAQKAQITGDNTVGYKLLTNMPNDSAAQQAIGSSVGACYSYEEATKVGSIVSIVDNTEENGSFTPVDSLDLDKQRITIKKEWENQLDERTQTNSITLNVVAADASVSQPPFATVEVGRETNPSWTNSVYISTGLLKVVGGQTIIYEHGHDFKLTEGEDLAYHWELEADAYRPMVITDADKGYNEPTAVLLKKVASDAAAGEYDYEIDGSKYKIVPTGSDALKAVNKRRSNLNLTKKVVEKDGVTDITNAVKDETFEFTITVTDKNEHDVWFSVYESTDPNANMVNVNDLTAIHAIPEEVVPGSGEYTGYYSIASGQQFIVHLKPGWNLRILNLPSGSTYTIKEITKEGYEFQNATIDNNGVIAIESDNLTVSGSINKPNTSFTITAINKLTANSILIRKTNLDGSQLLEGATFKLYKKNAQGVYELFKDTFTIGEGGFLCPGLLAGEYKLEEQTPPIGYVITVKEVCFTVSEGETNVITLANGQTNAVVSGTNNDTLSVKNEPGVALPNTGGPGSNLIYLLGITLIGLGGVDLVMKKKLRTMY